MAIMAPLAAIYMKFLNLAVFDPSNANFTRDIVTIGEFALVIAVVNILFVSGVSRLISGDSSKNWMVQTGAFIGGGGVAGGVLAFALFEQNVALILQGISGGIIAAILISLMVPRTLSRRVTASLTGSEI